MDDDVFYITKDEFDSLKVFYYSVLYDMKNAKGLRFKNSIKVYKRLKEAFEIYKRQDFNIDDYLIINDN